MLIWLLAFLEDVKGKVMVRGQVFIKKFKKRGQYKHAHWTRATWSKTLCWDLTCYVIKYHISI